MHSSDDAVSMPLQCATHWDALGHVSYMGRLYNGIPMDVDRRARRVEARDREREDAR